MSANDFLRVNTSMSPTNQLCKYIKIKVKYLLGVAVKRNCENQGKTWKEYG